jgi:hypothetical protein
MDKMRMMSKTVYPAGEEVKELLMAAMRGASTAPVTKEAAKERARKVKARKAAKKQGGWSKRRPK